MMDEKFEDNIIESYLLLNKKIVFLIVKNRNQKILT